jgi:hypothetical protein
MKYKITILTLGAMLSVFSPIAEAQQPGKIPRIGYISRALVAPSIPGLMSKHSGKGCVISVISTGKTS